MEGNNVEDLSLDLDGATTKTRLDVSISRCSEIVLFQDTVQLKLILKSQLS